MKYIIALLLFTSQGACNLIGAESFDVWSLNKPNILFKITENAKDVHIEYPTSRRSGDVITLTSERLDGTGILFLRYTFIFKESDIGKDSVKQILEWNIDKKTWDKMNNNKDAVFEPVMYVLSDKMIDEIKRKW